MKHLALGVGMVAALGMGLTIEALADYQGPGSEAFRHQRPTLSSVADVLKAAEDDQRVTLTGHIIRQIGRKEFLFQDETGEVVIEIDADVMPAQPFDEKTRVRIDGEAEKEEKKPISIEAKSLALL